MHYGRPILSHVAQIFGQLLNEIFLPFYLSKLAQSDHSGQGSQSTRDILVTCLKNGPFPASFSLFSSFLQTVKSKCVQ